MSGEQKRQGKTDEMMRFAKGRWERQGETEWISGRTGRPVKSGDAIEAGATMVAEEARNLVPTFTCDQSR